MLQAVRLPFVRFETQVSESKDEQGHIVCKNVYYAHITPAGGKDEVVKVADEWLRDLMEKSRTRGPFDQAASEYTQWYERFSKMFEQYKAGEEMTIDGTPVRSCPAFTKAEIAQAEAVKLMSVEDLATCNEEAVSRMGMGGRNLKLKAAKFLEDKQSGNVALENEALRVKVADLEKKVEAMLAAGIPEPKKVGRPRKEA